MRATFTVHENAPGTWVVGNDPNTRGFGTTGSFGVYLYANALWRCEGCGEESMPISDFAGCQHIVSVLDSKPTTCASVEIGYDPCDDVACGVYNIDGHMALTSKAYATPLCPNHADALQKSVEVKG